MCLVKVAQNGEEKGQRCKKGQQELGRLLEKCQQNFQST